LLVLIFWSFSIKAQAISSQNPIDKSVVITVSGQGKTIEEAKYSAFRSALEQAYGTFISSRTEIFNDTIFIDEVVSISNGNISKYEVIDEFKIAENSYSILLKVNVSISQLSKFVSNRGYESNFDGQSFAINLKMQKLNEDAEAKAILNSCLVIRNILKKSIDFRVENTEPKQVVGKNDEFNVTFNVNWVTNTNYNSFTSYFKGVLSKISMSENEILSYKNLNKDIYYISLFGELYIFRNVLSIIQLKNLFIQSNQFLHNFKIVYETGELMPSTNNVFKIWPRQWAYDGLPFPNIYFSSQYSRDGYSSWYVYSTLMYNFNIKGQDLFFNNLNFSNDWWEKAMRGQKERWSDDILFGDHGYLSDPVPLSILSFHTYVPKDLLTLGKYKYNNFGALGIENYTSASYFGKWTIVKSFSLSELEKIKKFTVINLN